MDKKPNNEHAIEGKRVYLRPITYEDSELIVKWRNQENVRRYFIYREPFTKEGQDKWMREQVETGKVYQFIVCENHTDRPIGCTYLRDINLVYRKAEYGVFLGEEDTRGKGIGKEILLLTMQFAFEQLHLHKVFARALADNPASIHCFLNSGFCKEATLRDDVYVDGEYRDVVFVGMLEEDYEKSKFCDSLLQE